MFQFVHLSESKRKH